jgi:hypothetical protein
MNDVFDRLDDPGDSEATAARMVEVVGRLEAGEEPAAVARALSLEPVEVVALLAHDAYEQGEGVGPELVQTAPRRPALARALSEPALAGLFPQATRPQRLALAAGLLQMHDFWDLSHQAAQQAGDLGEARSSAYWHGIAHRREPDPDNAAYWFRRVGRHPVFTDLAVFARGFEEAGVSDRVRRLAPRGEWDPLAFIDFCTTARGPDRAHARMIQGAEMMMLLGTTLPG